MLGQLFTTARGALLINSLAVVVGIALAIAIDTPRVGTIVFLSLTAAESGTFCLVYGLKSQWHREPAARAVMWAVLAYFGIAAHLLTMYIWSARWWWTDDLRELLYLGLAVAGLNLLLTLGRGLRA